MKKCVNFLLLKYLIYLSVTQKADLEQQIKDLEDRFSQEEDNAQELNNKKKKLEHDIDVSRGNTLVPVNTPYQQVSNFTAKLTWMDEQPLTPGKTFLLQHGVNRIKAKVVSFGHVIDMNTIEEKSEVSQFKLNDIGEVTIKTAKPIFADLYKNNPHNGAFILIDEFSNSTVAVGFIEKI